MFETPVGQFGAVDQPVDFQADIHEAAEVHYIADRSFHDGTNLQFAELCNIFTAQGSRRIFPGIAARFGQGLQDIGNGRQAGLQVFRNSFRIGFGGG